jgi:hypothetical protein
VNVPQQLLNCHPFFLYLFYFSPLFFQFIPLLANKKQLATNKSIIKYKNKVLFK